PDTGSTKPGKPLVIDVLGNDTPGGTPLDPKSVKLKDPVDGTYKSTVTIPGKGTFTADPTTGKVTFTPVPGFSGKVPPITYQVADTTGKQVTSTIQVDVQAPPPAVAKPDTGTGKPGQPVVIDPLKNDRPPNGGEFIPESIKLLDPITGKPVSTVKVPGEGTWVVNPGTGQVTFTPEPGFTGQATPIGYQVDDTLGGTTRSTMSARIDPPAPAPAEPPPLARTGVQVTGTIALAGLLLLLGAGLVSWRRRPDSARNPGTPGARHR
ncbi:MAG: Ig-like domain-containing protein, partial [Angustibacter sp.]